MQQIKALISTSTLSVAVISNLVLLASSAKTEPYDALCGNSGCTINVDARGISGPGGFIPNDLVSHWTVGSDSGYHGAKEVIRS